MNITARDKFNEAYDAISTTVAFDPAWKNSTGYLDNAVKVDLGLRPGERAKCVDDFKRRVIFVGTTLGNVVVFERYSPTEVGERSEVHVSNLPSGLSNFFNGVCGIGSRLTVEGLEILIGTKHSYVPNFGERVEVMKSLLNRAA